MEGRPGRRGGVAEGVAPASAAGAPFMKSNYSVSGRTGKSLVSEALKQLRLRPVRALSTWSRVLGSSFDYEAHFSRTARQREISP